MTRFKNENDAPSLSNAEWEVMKVFWDYGPMRAREVYQAVPDHNEWAYRTVKTLLSRLVAKGALSYEQEGKSYVYHPACSREHVTKEEMKSFIDRVLDGSVSPLIARFIEQEDISDSEIAELRRILDDRKSASGKKKRRRKQ